MPILRENPNILTEEEKKKRMFGSLKFIGRKGQVNDKKNTKENHLRQSKSDVKAKSKEPAVINSNTTESNARTKVQERATRKSRRNEKVEPVSETSKRCPTIDHPGSRPRRSCTVKSSSNQQENTDPLPSASNVVLEEVEVLATINSVSTSSITAQATVRRNESFGYFMRKHKRSLARKTTEIENATPKRVSSFYRRKLDDRPDVSTSKHEECSSPKTARIQSRQYIGNDEQQTENAPTVVQESSTDEEIDVINDTESDSTYQSTSSQPAPEDNVLLNRNGIQVTETRPFSVAAIMERGSIESTVSTSPEQSHILMESPNSSTNLHELTTYLTQSPTITTADVENALRIVNRKDHTSPSQPSSLENFVRSVTALVSEFGFGHLHPASQLRSSNSFAMSPPPSPTEFVNEGMMGPAKSHAPELPPLDANIVQFFMQMWQMWNKAGEMAAAHVAAMNIGAAVQAPRAVASGNSAKQQVFSRTIVETTVSVASPPIAPAVHLPVAPQLLPAPVAVPPEPVSSLHSASSENEETDSDEEMEEEDVEQDTNQESAAPSPEPTLEHAAIPETTSNAPNAESNTIEQPSEQLSPNTDLLDTLRVAALPSSQVVNKKLTRRLTGPPTMSWPLAGPLKRKNSQADSSSVKRAKLEIESDPEQVKMCVLCLQKEANTYMKPCKCAHFCMSCALFWKDDVRMCPVHEEIRIEKICGMRR